MIKEDFKTFNIHNFSPSEVEATGANINDVKIKTIVSLQSFREFVRRKVLLIKNGITTGIHKATEHQEGLAVDCYLDPLDGSISIHDIFKGALTAGFHGIGIYWNGAIYSFHFDHRSRFAFWVGVKDNSKGITEWQWFSLLQDPTKIQL